MIFLFLFFLGVSNVAAENFTGTATADTGTFVSAVYTKIDWTYTPANEFDLFSVAVKNQSDSTTKHTFNDATAGTTYLYHAGTFYCSVSAANVASWSITTAPTTGEFASNGTIFTGKGNLNTKLFQSLGNTRLTWNCTAENQFESFQLYVYAPGSALPELSLSGNNGSAYFYEEGDFYCSILAANLVAWNVTVDIFEPITLSGGFHAFTGTGSTTTDGFVSDQYLRIDWECDIANSFAVFSVSIKTYGTDTQVGSFDGTPNGTTYLYKTGEFYLQVNAANLNSWAINITPSTGEIAPLPALFMGNDDCTTKIFSTGAAVRINWTATPANEYDLFSATIRQLATGNIVHTLSNISGQSTLYVTGNFYIVISAANIESWQIRVSPVADDSTSGTSSSTTSSTTTSSAANNPDAQIDGFSPLAIIGMSILILSLLAKRKFP
jgi:hypothetical protein